MNSKFFRSLCLAAAVGTIALDVRAAGFAAGISPSKFELRAQAGDVVRDTVTIVNPGGDPADYLFKTADWRLTDSGNVEFTEASLTDGSCRPWVRLERRTLRINPGAQRNYRFEVHVPDDAPAGLCRFAILVEPAEAIMTQVGSGDSAIAVPIVGRYAVVTYVTIGDAQASVELVEIGTQESNGERVPMMRLRNTGTTYDRAIGQLTAIDFSGERYALVPSSFPVLPGRLADVAIIPDVGPEDIGSVSLKFPLRLTGDIEIGGQRIEIDEVLE